MEIFDQIRWPFYWKAVTMEGNYILDILMLAEIWGEEKLWRSVVISKYDEDEWHFWTPRSP